jgi:class 3 adenylate cyclase
MDSLSVKRRLTCILAADAVGYSRQMANDEEGTIRVLAAHRSVIDGIIAFHQGRIIGTAGDSVLAEFASAVEAVRSAIEIQDAIRTRNDSLPEDRRMVFRVGVNLGDVVVKDDDILGDGVNVAARLESIAEPGGVCISSSVYDQITGKLDLGFQDIGEQTLKNISRPIRVYRVSGTAPAARATPAARSMPRATVYAGIGAVVVLALVGLVSWQTGWLRSGVSDDKRAAATASSPASPPSATAANPDAEAKRVQAEADAARIRADAEAIKRQAEADAAKIRTEADAQRAAKTKADADAAAARTRAQAEADASRIRAEAERQAKSAVAQATPGATPPAAPSPATAPASVPVAPAPRATSLPGASAAFEGDWNVTITCPAGESAQGYRIEFPGRVKDGALRAVRGVEGSPDSLRLEGDIKPDGSALLVAHGRTGDPKYSVGGVAASTPYSFTVKAQFEGSSGVGKRQEMRPCEVRFTKQ